MSQIQFLTNEEIESRLKKLSQENWKVKKFIEDGLVKGGYTKETVDNWTPASRGDLLKRLGIKEVEKQYIAIEQEG